MLGKVFNRILNTEYMFKKNEVSIMSTKLKVFLALLF